MDTSISYSASVFIKNIKTITTQLYAKLNAMVADIRNDKLKSRIREKH